MKLIYLLIFLLTPSFALPVYAQTANGLEEPAAAAVGDFSDEGLGDEDLTTDLAAEALPTTDAVSYWWENLRDNVINVFTFNITKKAARLRLQLHRLDRKLAACAELGDEECVAKIEERTRALQERTERYIARHQELREQHQQRFAEWRARRAARVQELHQRAAERRNQHQELLQQRQQNRRQAIKNRQQNRQSTVEQRQQNRQDVIIQQRQEGRQDSIEQRQQNRERLIELRSQNLKNKLDATRQQAEEHQQNLRDAESNF